MKHIGDLKITKENEKEFAGLIEVSGTLAVSGDAKLDAPALTTVGGYVYVRGDAKLDAPALTTVGGYVYVSGDAKLDAPALTTVGGYVYESGDAKLDAPALTTVGGSLAVYGDAKLDALTTVGGSLAVYGDAKLDAPALTTVGGSLAVYGDANIPKNVKTNDQEARGYCEKKLKLSFKKEGLIKADGILSWLKSSRKLGQLVCMRVQIVGKLEISYLVQKGSIYSHGKTFKEAKESLRYKISDRDTSEYKSWKLTDTKTTDQLIQAYRAITGACEFGVKEFCESEKLKTKYKVKEVIELTKDKFGNKEFEEFFR